MTRPSPTPDLPTTDLLSALIRAHRDTQADHRAALAADHDRDLDTASRRLAAINARLCVLGQPDLAEQLDKETRSGTALIVALTCCDAHRPDELGAAVTAFADHRARVDAARAQWPATG
jgi:hypothetical protein